MTTGMIGLGAMGLPMSKNMVERGQRLIGFDVSRERIEQAQAHGVETAKALAELTETADVVVVCLPDDGAMRQLGDDLLPLLGAGQLLIITGTHDPQLMIEIDSLLAPTGVGVVDGPVVFGGTRVETGMLYSLLGGDESNVELARPVVMGYSADADHIGPIGAGQLAKACNNYLHWVHAVSNFEALVLARRYGVDAETMRDVLLKAPGDNGTLRAFDRYNFTWHEKDMDLVLDLAQRGDLMLPMAAQADQLVKSITRSDVADLLSGRECVYLGRGIEAQG